MPLRPRHLAASLASGAVICSTLAGVGAPLASAAPTIPDPGVSASLDIHKFNGLVDATNPADGRTLTDAQKDKLNLLGVPMAGVAFDVYPVQGVDLSTNAGWQAAGALQGLHLTPADVAAGQVTGTDGTSHTLGTPVQVVTDADGNATFTGPLGLYLVAENRSASQLTEEMKNGLTPAAPFLVTLPMTDPTTQSGWDYSVDVYPKNVVNTIVKSVRDGNRDVTDQDTYAVGQKLTYHLSSSVVVSDNNGDGRVDGADLGYYYAVIDALDPHLSFEGAAIAVLSADWKTSTPLAEGTDYVLRHDGGRVTVSMTAAGLDKLAANAGGSVESDIVATVATMPDDGIVPNTAAFIPSNGWLVGQGTAPRQPGDDSPAGGPEIPSAKVESKFGDIVIGKRGAQAGQVDWASAPALAGARFSVYRAGTDGTCTLDGATDPIATSEPTDQAGITVVRGLQLSDWANGSTITDPAQLRSYCLVETKAPAGYELLTAPVKFDLTVAGHVADPTSAFADTSRDADVLDAAGGSVGIVDVPKKALPGTGGAGTAAFSLLALAGIGGGAWRLAAARRRRRA